MGDTDIDLSLGAPFPSEKTESAELRINMGEIALQDMEFDWLTSVKSQA